MNASFFIYPSSMALGGVGLKALGILTCIILIMGAASAGFSPRLTGDTYVVEGDEEESFGIEEELWVASEEGEPVSEIYLSFLGVSGKSAAEIDSATLEMYATEVDVAGDVGAYFCNSVTFEDTLTWADKPLYDEDAADTVSIGEDEEAAEGEEASFDEESEEDAGRWYTWDVTSIVKSAAEECQNCGFTIVLVADGDASIEFATKEGVEDHKAVLKYTVNSG